MAGTVLGYISVGAHNHYYDPKLTCNVTASSVGDNIAAFEGLKLVTLRSILTENQLAIDVSCYAVELGKLLTRKITLNPSTALPPNVHIILAGKSGANGGIALNEHSEAGLLVATASVQDISGSNRSLSFVHLSIVDDPCNALEVRGKSIYTSTKASLLDFETQPFQCVVVLAASIRSKGYPLLRAVDRFRLELIDVNEPAEIYPLMYTTVKVDAVAGAAVARIDVSDQETAPENITCKISGNPLFSLSPSRIITLVSSPELSDMPGTDLLISCWDPSPSPVVSTKKIYIPIEYANQPPTSIDIRPYNASSNEWYHSDRFLLGSLYAVDPDGAQDILGLNVIDSDTGTCNLNGPFLRLGGFRALFTAYNNSQKSCIFRATDSAGNILETEFVLTFFLTSQAVRPTIASVSVIDASLVYITVFLPPEMETRTLSATEQYAKSRHRRSTTLGSSGTVTLSVSATSFPETLPLGQIATLTIIDSNTSKYIDPSAILGLKSGHEYTVSVRAHDVVAVGVNQNLWSSPDFPSLATSNNHTKSVSATIRIDTSAPELQQFYLVRTRDGFTDKIDILPPNSPLLSSLSIQLYTPGNGVAFIDQSAMEKLEFVYAVYDPESSISEVELDVTEVSFGQDYSAPIRTLAANNYAVLSGTYGVNNAAQPTSSRSPNCTNFVEGTGNSAVTWSGVALFQSQACSCTTFGSNDLCAGQYYKQKLGLASPLGNGSLKFRNGLASYTTWNKFEFTLNLNVKNYATVLTTNTLNVRVDLTPPTDGMVLDAPSILSMDIDYMQPNDRLTASWSNFTDAESGVLYYEYYFGQTCITASMFCGIGCVDGDTGNCVDSPTCLAMLNTTLYNIFRNSRGTMTGATYNPTGTPLQTGMYYATVVAYNRALGRSKFICSDGVLVDATPPILADIRVQSVRIKPGLITDYSKSSVWLLTADGVRHAVASPSSACKNKALVVPNLDAYPNESYVAQFSENVPIKVPTSSTYVFKLDDGYSTIRGNISIPVATTNACTTYPAAALYQFNTEKLALLWSGGDAESDIDSYEVSALDNIGYAGNGTVLEGNVVLAPDTTHKQNYYFNTRVGALTDASSAYYRITATNKAQMDSTMYIGPIVVDRRAPTVLVTANNIVLQQHSFIINASWPTMNNTFGAPISGICTLSWCLGASAQLCDTVPWTLVRPLDATTCNVDSSLPSSLTWNASAVDMEDGHTYYFALRATSGSGISAVSPPASVLYISTVPQANLVADVLAPVTTREVNIGDDIDYLPSGTCCIIAQWAPFNHVLLGEASYTATLIVDNVNISTVNLGNQNIVNFSASLIPLPLVHRQVSVRVRAYNPIGYTEVESDGVLLVPGGASTGKVWRGSTCSTAKSLIKMGDFESAASIVDGGLPLSSVSVDALGIIFGTNATIDALANPDVSGTNGLNSAILSPHSMLEVVVRTVPGTQYTLTLQAVQQAASTLTGVLDVHLLSRVTLSDGPSLEMAYWPLILPATSGLSDFTSYNRTFQAPGLFIHLRILLHSSSPATLIDNLQLVACQMDPPSTTRKSINFWWDGLPGPNQYISHYEYAVVSDPKPTPAAFTLNTVRSDQFVVPFTFNGQLTSASLDGPFDSDSVYFFVVRSCYPRGGGCFDPVLSDAMVIESNPPVETNVVTQYAEVSQGIHITAAWQHWEEVTMDANGTSSDTIVQTYMWSLGMSPSGTDIVIAWQPLTKTLAGLQQGITWSPSSVTIDVVATLSAKWSGEALYFLVKGFSLEGAIKSIAVPATALSVAPRVVLDVPSFIPADLQSGATTYTDIEVTSASTQLAAVWPLNGLLQVGWGDCEGYTFEWTIAAEPLTSGVGCAEANDVLRCGETTDFGVSAPGLDLVDAELYFVCIRIISAVGLGGTALSATAQQRINTFVACSDGVVVDLSPPIAAPVFVGEIGYEGDYYSSVAFELSVVWGHFEDLEEITITQYAVALGTFVGAQDIMARRDVGDVTSYLVTNLSLSDGVTCYATVWATDKVGLETASYSQGVMIDTTPPTLGFVYDGDDEFETFQQDAFRISTHWTGFVDAESGIDHYEWAVGTSAGATDIMPWRVTTSMTEAEVNLLAPLDEGQTVYVSLRAHNGAGLHTTAFSSGMAVDTSAPLIGYVHDGARINGASIDQEYQTVRDRISTHWGGFSDPQSGILNFRWGLGSAPGQLDIRALHDVGMQTEITFTNLALRDGQVVFATVEACNNAHICARASSDGITIDGSPPTPGNVQDGYAGRDLAYTSSNTVFSLHWFGFYDPHSPIAFYEWCASTTLSNCSLIGWTQVYLATQSFGSRTGSLTLPSNIMLYGFVRATNKAGLSVIGTSDGVQVDITAPTVVVNAAFSLGKIGSSNIVVNFPEIASGYQPFLSILRATWKYQDSESGIHHVVWSVRVHHDGYGQHQPVDPIYVTSAEEGVHAQTVMYDNDEYFLTMLVCNGAELCMRQEDVAQIVIDSSPPSVGVLDDKMTWSTTGNTKLAFSDFADSHTGVNTYHVSLNGASLTFTGSINMPIPVAPSVFPNGAITLGQRYYMTVRAWSYGGVSSSFTSAVEAQAGGRLAILSEVCDPTIWCTRQYMTLGSLSSDGCWPAFGTQDGAPRQCYCNIPAASCDNVTIQSLTYDATAWNNLVVTVYDGFQVGVDIDYQPFSSALGGSWAVTAGDSSKVIRYDWTVGKQLGSNASKPCDGFYGGSSEVWNPAGLVTHGIFTVPAMDPTIASLSDDSKYYIWVRVWLADRYFKIFRSNGVTVRAKGPQLKPSARVLDGQTVKNADYWNGSVPIVSNVSVLPYVDVEYQVSPLSLSATWGWNSLYGLGGMFIQPDLSYITRFEWAAGLSPGGVEGKPFAPPGFGTTNANNTALSDTYQLPAGSLAIGKRYYASVRAFDVYGLQVEYISNGVTVDNTQPTAGTVHDGADYRDHDAVSSTTTISASWQGFSDFQSGISSYEVAIATSKLTNQVMMDSTRDSQFRYSVAVPQSGTQFVSVGRRTSIVQPTSLWSISSLVPGQTYYVFVRAKNGADLVGDAVASDGFTVDTTGPLPAACVLSGANLVADSSFELGGAWNQTMGNGGRVASNSSRIGSPTKSAYVYLMTNGSGESGEIAQMLTTTAGSWYRLTFYAAGYPNGAIVGQVGRVLVGDLDRAFALAQGHIDGYWRTFDFNFVAASNQTMMKISAVGNGLNRGMAIDTVVVTACLPQAAQTDRSGDSVTLPNGRAFAALSNANGLNSPQATSKTCQTTAVALPAGWQIAEDTNIVRSVVASNSWGTMCVVLSSGLAYYTALGTVPGSACPQCNNGQSSCLQSNNNNNGATTYGIYNNCQLRNEATIILIEKAAAVNVGKLYQNSESHIQAWWTLFDSESAIIEYYWAIGTVPGGAQLMPFTSTGAVASGDAYDLQLHHGMSVYVTVVGLNTAGLSDKAVSNAIAIDHTPPVFVGGVLDLNSAGATVDADLTSSSTLRASWAGVMDAESGLQWCDVGFGREPGSVDIYPFTPVTVGNDAGLSVQVSTIPLVHGETYYATVKCANMADLISSATSNGITYVGHAPSVAEATISVSTPVDLQSSNFIPDAGFQSVTNSMHFKWMGFPTLRDTLTFEYFVQEMPRATICPSGTYYDPNIFLASNAHCKPCASEACTQCTGPSQSECQACYGGYVFDGRGCYYHDCPTMAQGVKTTYLSDQCWVPTNQFTSVSVDYSSRPLLQCFTYMVSVRGMYTVGGSILPSSNIATSVIIDSTPPNAFSGLVTVAISSGLLSIDWKDSFSEDCTTLRYFVALGSADYRGQWGISDWIATGAQTHWQFKSSQIIADATYVIGIKAVNQAGLISVVTQDVPF